MGTNLQVRQVYQIKASIIKIFELYTEKKLSEADITEEPCIEQPLEANLECINEKLEGQSMIDGKKEEIKKPEDKQSIVYDVAKYGIKAVLLKSTYELAEISSFIPRKKIMELTVEPSSLQYFISKFVKEERLDGENKLLCEFCKYSTPIFKRIEFSQFGKVLIIHLKRFKIVNKDKREKIDTNVEFPHQLTLKTDTNVTSNFRLFAVLNHIGNMESGHYTAYCRDITELEKWREFDDNRVKDVTNIQSDKAYVLFYECL